MKIKKTLFATCFVNFWFLANPSAAQSVELVSKVGRATVHGTLIAARNDQFVVRTNIGVVTLDRNSVICSGSACPVKLADKSDMTIAAPAELADIIVPLLADGFATSQEIEARLLNSDGIPLDGAPNREDQVRNNQANENHSLNIQLIGSSGEPTANIAVKSAGHEQIFDLLSTREASLVLSEKSASTKNVDTIQSSGGGNIHDFDQERVIAVDGYVVVANPRNDVHSMTLQQVSDVMSGKIDNWAALGGPNHAINVYSFKLDTEAFHHINDLVLKPYQQGLTPEARIVKSNRELTIAIEEDPYGVGIVSYSSVRDTRPVAIENECGMVTEPSRFNIKTEEYTLQNRITVYNRQDKGGMVPEFLNYIDGPTLDDLVTKSGLISLSITQEGNAEARARLRSAVESSTEQVSSPRLQQFVLDVMDTTRLSTTFRFALGSTTLDNKAQRDLGRVLRYVEDVAPKRLVLVGFADSRGGFAQNLSLSESRAQAVFKQLKEADTEGWLKNTQIDVRGYGELAPVACNESFQGRATNRRVEMWVR